jgi:hypothetical protein
LLLENKLDIKKDDTEQIDKTPLEDHLNIEIRELYKWLGNKPLFFFENWREKTKEDLETDKPVKKAILDPDELENIKDELLKSHPELDLYDYQIDNVIDAVVEDEVDLKNVIEDQREMCEEKELYVVKLFVKAIGDYLSKEQHTDDSSYIKTAPGSGGNEEEEEKEEEKIVGEYTNPIK